jgi:hypothetical protein
MKATAKSTMIIGSIRKGLMQINAGEQVDVIRESKKCFYVFKNGMTKAIPKEAFN